MLQRSEPSGDVGDAPLASVVITNHDYARFLPRAIESALAQTHARVEVIVVDDGSQDGSRAVIEGFRERVQPVFKDNGGHASAINAGFAASRGHLVLFLDADDALGPEAVAEAAAALTGDVASVQWYLDVVDSAGRSVGARIPGVPPDDGDLRALTLRSGPGSRVCPPCSGLAWSRSFLTQVMPIPETVPDAGAEPFLTDTAPVLGSVVTLPLALGVYRVHDASMQAQIDALSVRALDRVSRSYAARRTFLATHTGSEPGRWDHSNWRLLAVALLLARLGEPRSSLPPLRTLMAAGWAARTPAPRRLVVVAFLLALRVLPRPLVMRIAPRGIHPRSL